MLRIRVSSIILITILLFCLGACTSQEKSSEISERGDKISEASDKIVLSELESIVTATNRSEYDFTDKALEYLTIIGEKFPERSIVDEKTGKADDKFGEWLINELVTGGYDPKQISEQRFWGDTVFGDPVQGRNIILTIPGQEEGQIIVGAHYDGSGIGDNGSGTALLLATAVSLVDIRPQYTIHFIFFDREEAGKVGSRYYASRLSDESIAKTLYMINLDSIIFGDYCNIYGGVYGDNYDLDYFTGDTVEAKAEHLEGYDFAADLAEKIGFQVYRPKDLDGYYAANGHGMELQENAFFTNPWTYENPAPENQQLIGPSPCTFGVSDHAPFAVRGIPYIYFEATNWWAKGTDPNTAFMGYTETFDESIGDGGQIMNTEYDTLDTLRRYFPNRAEQHYRLYSPLLSSLLLVKQQAE